MPNEIKPNRSGNYHHNGNPKHGLYRDNAALFNVWQTMKNRCENPRREKYKELKAWNRRYGDEMD